MKALRLVLPFLVVLLATSLTFLASQATVTGGTAATVNGAAITMPWLDSMAAVFTGDGGLQQIAGLQNQPTFQTTEGESRPPPPLLEDQLKRSILTVEIVTQIQEGILGKLASEGNEAARSVETRRRTEERLTAEIAQRRAPGAPPISDEAIETIVRWGSVSSQVLAALLPEQPTEEVLGQIYDEFPLLGRRVCLQVIRVKDRETAEKVEEKLRERASFTAVAEEFSDDLPSKPRKGDLGCLTATEVNRRQLDPALFQAAAANQPGRVQGPIQGELGGIWYVRTKDEGNAGADFESALPQLFEQYATGRALLARAIIGRGISEADIRVSCDVGRWEPQFGVVPCGELPGAPFGFPEEQPEGERPAQGDQPGERETPAQDGQPQPGNRPDEPGR